MKTKREKKADSNLTWEVSMDGMSDARGPLQGDVVKKHGSLSKASPQGSSGAANGALSPAQNCGEIMENKLRNVWMDSSISVNAVNTTNVLNFTGTWQCVERDIQTELNWAALFKYR